MAEKKPIEMDDTPAPQGPSTAEAILELVKVLASQRGLDEGKSAEIAANVSAQSYEKVHHWFDEKAYPHVSAFNPRGEKDHPNPKLLRDVFWIGYRLNGDELMKEEIELLNRLKPGKYDMHAPNGMVERREYFQVLHLDPQLPTDEGRLLVMFPCKSPDERMQLARYDRGRGMVDMLLELVPGARAEYPMEYVA